MIGLIKGTARQLKTVSGLPLPIASYKSNSKLPIQELSLSINPTQDLHGYDNPWGGGGGTNKLPPFTNGTYTQNSIKAVVKDGLVTVTGQKDTASGINLTLPLSKTFTLKQNDYLHIRNSNSNASITLSFAGAGWSPAFASANRIIQYTGSDASVTGVTIYFAGTVTEEQNFTFQPSLEVGSAVTDWTPYENICPITGVSSVNVADVGNNDKLTFFKGLLDGTYSFVDLGNAGWTYDSTTLRFQAYVNANVKQISSSSTIANIICAPYQTVSGINQYNDLTLDMTISQGSGPVVFRIRDLRYTDATQFKAALSGVHLIYELATPTTPTITPSEFEALLTEFGINGWCVNVQLGDTYYGGELYIDEDGNVKFRGINGYAIINVNKTHNFGVNASGYGRAEFSMTSLGAPKGKSGSTAAENVCDKLKSTNPAYSWNYGTKYSCAIYTEGTGVRITASNAENTSALMDAWLTTLGDIMLIYPLATPIEIDLTPTQINSLLGSNNIWHDGNGDVEVLKFMDRQLYFGR